MLPLTLKEREEDLALLRSAAVAAGITALGFFRRDIKTWTKENASPVSEADCLVDEFLASNLLAARPGYGWLSEETFDDQERLNHKHVFICDPIDGTRGFIRGEDSWTICLSVVEDGEPIAGVVYAPARDELYEAVRGGGARLNGDPIVRRTHQGTGPIIPAPGAVYRELDATGLDYVRGPAIPSLAYRMVQVTTGVLDAAVARRGAQDWDISAAAVILSECGITLEDVCRGPVRFNREETRHGALAACKETPLKAELRRALIKVYGCPDNIVTQVEPYP